MQGNTDGHPGLAAPAESRTPRLTDAELRDDPHGVLRFHRARTPLVMLDAGVCYVLRHADIVKLVKDPRAIGTGTALPKLLGVTEGPLFEAFEHGMLTANGEVHRRRRSPFTPLLAARALAGLRPVIRRSAESLVDGWRRQGRVDFAGDFAARLPALVISGLLGLPRKEIPSTMRLAQEVTRFLNLAVPPGEIPIAEAATRQLQTYVEGLILERRRSPREDFLSGFIAAADEAKELSPMEMVIQLIQIIVAGTDTTRVASIMTTGVLLQHRDQWQEVCRDPGLVPMAVEEGLRFEPSVATFSRLAAEDIELGGGAVIPGGSFISLSVMSAMRDERVYEDPDTFDIRRRDHPPRHPVFGGGVHRCIGEALARMELEEGLATLVERYPDLRLLEAPVIEGHSGIRRADRMVVSCRG